MSVKRLFDVARFISRHPLSRGRKLRNFVRFIAWQIVGRVSRRPRVVKFAGRSKLLLERGLTGGTGNIYVGLHEFRDMSFLLHLLREDDLFIDIGANIGSYTVLASSEKKAKTIAIEPIPSTFAWLMKNIEVNDIGHVVEPHNLGLAGEKGVMRFTATLDTMNRVSLDGKEHQEDCLEVSVNTLDDLLKDRVPALIKMDVEGFESEVIRGGANTLSNSGLLAVIIEINGSGEQYGHRDEDLHNSMLQYGFSPVDYMPFDRKLINIDGLPELGGNVIYVRDLAAAQRRVLSSEPFEVLGRKI